MEARFGCIFRSQLNAQRTALQDTVRNLEGWAVLNLWGWRGREG